MMIRDKDLASIQEARDLVDQAYQAQKKFSRYSQQEIDDIVRCMAEMAVKEAGHLARMAVEETGMGVYEDKVVKNIFSAQNVYQAIKDMKTIGVIGERPEDKIIEIGVPVGVIAALIPTTNPTSTAIYKCLIALKAKAINCPPFLASNHSIPFFI